MFVAPSPKNATATRFSPRIWKASAAPTIPGSPPPTTAFAPRLPTCDVVEVHRAAVSLAAAFDLPVQLGHDPFDGASPSRSRARARGASRRSRPRARARRRPRRRRLLPDRDVQEPGQLARHGSGPSTFSSNRRIREHLAEEPAQELPRIPLPSGPGSLFDGRHRAAIMLIRRCEPPISGRGSRRASRRAGPRFGLSFVPEGSARRRGRRARAASARPRRRASFRFDVERTGGVRSGHGTSSRRMDRKRVWGTLSLVGVSAVAADGLQRLAPPPVGRTRSSPPGTRRWPSSRPGGATCSASSGSTRPTTSRVLLCSARR